jgi:tetratricopeptide (TPR) repeat protein
VTAITPWRAFFLIAVVAFSPRIALRGDSSRALQQRGIEAFNARQFAVAERLFSALVQQDPSGVTYAYLASTEGALGKYSRAIVHFRRAIQLGNDTPVIRYNLALAYLKDDQLTSGIRELQTALIRSPQFTQARYALGAALVAAGRPREALTYLDQLQSPLQKKPDFWVNLISAEFGAGDATEALHSIDRAMETVHEDTSLTVTLANLCASHGYFQKARELLEDAIEVSPRNNELKLLLAHASLKAVDLQEVLAVLKNVPPEAGVPGEVAFLRGTALLLGGKPKEATPFLDTALAADPHNLDYISTYAELQASQRNYDGALASLKEARQLRPNAPDFPYQMALIYVFMRRYSDAEAACQNAMRLAPDFDLAYFVMGSIELDQGKTMAAEEAFRRAVSIKPASALYHAALGAALFKNGRVAQGEEELDRALLLDPKTFLAYFWRAAVFAHQNKTAKAIADLETFVALDSHYPDAYKRLAELYGVEGQQTKASAAQAKYKTEEEESPAQPLPFFLSQLRATLFGQAHGLNQ